MIKVEKIKLIISLIVWGLLIIAGIFAAFNKNWIHLALAALTIFLTFLPSIIGKKFKINYPTEFEIVILIFLYAAMYLGELQDFYFKFWWWDLMLHTVSGIIIAIIGFALVQILNEETATLKLSPGFIAIFSFSFSLTIGSIWEIFEFLMDSALGLKMQKSGLVDTMWDLIVNTFGAAAISYLGYLYLKKDYHFLKKYRELLRKK